MTYRLFDGQIVDLDRIESVSTVRDFGRDPRSIDRSQIGFTIQLNNREIIDVVEFYHFCDWAQVSIKLKKVREDIVHQWLDHKDQESLGQTSSS